MSEKLRTDSGREEAMSPRYERAHLLGQRALRILEEMTGKRGNLDVQHASHGKEDEFNIGFHVGNVDRLDPRADGVSFYIETSPHGCGLYIKYLAGSHELMKEFSSGPEDITDENLREALDEALEKYKTSTIR